MVSADGVELGAAAADYLSPFPRIGDYAFLSDCETVALVAPSGAIEWMCLPSMDSPSIFGALLDRDAGFFRLGPTDYQVPATRRYLPGTMVLETSWWTRRGWLWVRDALLIGPWDRERVADAADHRRAPTDYQAEHVLLREVRCVSGEAQVVLECAPMFDYGRDEPVWSHEDDCFNRAVARLGGSGSSSGGGGGGLELHLTTDLRLGFEGPIATARTRLKAGDRRFCALSWSDSPPPPNWDEAYRRQVWTAHHWQHWLERGRFPDHPWTSYLQRSALTLRSLMLERTGALAAAATTSLPETPGGERNWDYRYSWLRDSAATILAFEILGFGWEANDFFYFVADLARGDQDLQIMYGLDGRSDLEEETLDHLTGYEGARPVRIGNAAHAQEQHDVWGAVVLAVWLHARSHDRLPSWLWPIVVTQVERALESWRQPDRGIWEVRGEPRHFTSSKTMCWVAASYGARLARIQGEDKCATTWEHAAEEIKADICEKGLDDRGVFTQHYDTTSLDASVLLMPLLGFLPPDDERIQATVLAVADELTDNGLVLRYRTEDTDDGLAGREGSFTACSFWLVHALVEIGELARARELCERVLSYTGPLELYAEEIDPQTGRQLGNFPQALSHLALVTAVSSVIRAERGMRAAHLSGQPTPMRPNG